MITIIKRKFLPNKIKVTAWEVIEPYFTQLLNQSINSVQDLEKWLQDKSELEAFLSEDLAWRYVKMTCNTEDKSLEESYLFFVNEIEPKISPYYDKFNRKLVACNYVNELDNDKYFIYLRSVKKEIEIFREENIPLFAEIATESQKYGAIVGSMMVEIEGKQYTLQQAANFLKSTDRTKRENVFNLINTKRLAHADELDNLFNKLIKLRHQVAVNAGFANYRDYMFAALGRFDYTPEDCFAFHEAIQKEVVPLVKDFNTKRAEELGHALKPWDMDVDTKNREALEPFTSGADLLNKTVKCFRKVDDYFAWCIETMDNMNRLDLESRKGKAPGGYNYPMAETNVPFIFMNAASSTRDVETMVHEGGHAVHSFLSKDLELSAFKNCPSEVAELASMSMELISYDGQDEFYTTTSDLNRAKEEHLEGIIKILPWIATIDKFQHWIYTNPNHTIDERKNYWQQLAKEFGTGLVDWSDLEKIQAYTWQKQLHLFEVPFYYIEYGIAQLGALAVWKNFLNNKTKTVQQYKDALKLGYTKPIGEIYKTAGIEFNFSANYIKQLMQFVKEELNKCAN
ncbi:MAG: M3 family oligoendopeptidase [Bacteroidia bacterium]|nr:M3 family oligoendopeptidase [Bacteroidia bacterium]MCZ2141659.1 M3 family oligoendopeptidase [Bacteroidia bacterium]